jgi:DNA-binding NarL/FixJ family response regulator
MVPSFEITFGSSTTTTVSLCSDGRRTLIRPRVLLADDHPALLAATTSLLKAQFDVVGTATDGATLVSEALRLCPDVIVADITMPVLSGIDAAHRLRESALSAKIVFLTVHSEEPFMKACMAEGALGYVLKSHMKAHLIPAIQAALGGQSYICPFVPT